MNCLKSMRPILAASLALFVLASCGSQMERDAEKMAKLAIEFEQVQKRFGDRSNLHGKPMSRKEFESYNREYIEFTNQMLEKYSETPEMRRDFQDMVNDRINKLK